MNIALCFSGQVRDFDKTQRSLRRCILAPLSRHKLFLFAHYAGDNSNIPSNLHFEDKIYDECEPDFSELQNLGHDVIERSWHQGKSLTAYLRQLRSISISDSLCRKYELSNSITFDWIFRLRFDNLYITRIENLTHLSRNIIYIPAHDNWRGLNDRFAFGPSLLMNTYANRLESAIQAIQGGIELNPEIFLAKHLEQSRIKVGRTRVTHHLLRYSNLWRASFLAEQGDDLKFQPKRFMAPAKDEISSMIGKYRYERIAKAWWQRP